MRYIDLMHETGGDILWDDAGWYDKWGTWTAPDWRRTTDYLKKYGMRWVLWYPTFIATPESAVGQQHPDWLIPRRPVLEHPFRQQSIGRSNCWIEALKSGAIISGATILPRLSAQTIRTICSRIKISAI